ncbi:phosphotransferase [Ruegeria sp. EL01]|jgi:Ser/Thr protein kinase RdoA (MazF antagonist)|uniref:phosphotransferase n=1 Tax=Ruegeria sp. EL01 TaxID=2107578 RepID=UPI000EA819A4|nr:phosphotransferase [Ruegeria sp. EL01]
MNNVIAQALSLWGMDGAATHLIAARENSVYNVSAGTGPVALRLHRQGYRTDAELWSELEWMSAVSKGGISVPTPIASQSGKMLHVIEGVQVDVLSWLPGVPLADTVTEMAAAGRATLFHSIGREMARLHLVSDSWDRPYGFVRCAWDREGLLGDAPLWDRFWDNPALSADDRNMLLALRRKASADLVGIGGNQDYGLIHADLVSANIMVSNNALSLIDFDDGGFGFRLFEIATALLKFSDDTDFPTIRSGLIKGYQAIRPIDLTAIDMFMALRAASYVGWNITRMNEKGGAARNERFIDAARHHASVYLSQ